MNEFLKAMKSDFNYGLTENGGIKHTSTLNKVLDMLAMGGAMRHRSDEDVFEGPFLSGYHGGPLAWGHPRNVPKMSPSPWELIEEFFNRYDF